jgi:hypothetical protein
MSSPGNNKENGGRRREKNKGGREKEREREKREGRKRDIQAQLNHLPAPRYLRSEAPPYILLLAASA